MGNGKMVMYEINCKPIILYPMFREKPAVFHIYVGLPRGIRGGYVYELIRCYLWIMMMLGHTVLTPE